MLGDIGSIASLAGVVVSLLGLGFAILQLHKLRGETRAAKEAAEAARNAVNRGLAVIDITRTYERVGVLKSALSDRKWRDALRQCPDIRRALITIRYRHPNLGDHDGSQIVANVEFLERFEHTIGDRLDNMSDEAVREFNQGLIGLQTFLSELENKQATLD